MQDECVSIGQMVGITENLAATSSTTRASGSKGRVARHPRAAAASEREDAQVAGVVLWIPGAGSNVTVKRAREEARLATHDGL
eukprot:1760758-Pleurochrysis_carterae.AAC.1